MGLRRALCAALLGAAPLLACDSSTIVQPPPGAPLDGRLAGTVTLRGSDAPAWPMLAHLSLYASAADVEARRAAHDVPLLRPDAARATFTFDAPTVRSGRYYVAACFDFTCRAWRDATTGALIPVDVVAGETRVVDLSF